MNRCLGGMSVALVLAACGDGGQSGGSASWVPGGSWVTHESPGVVMHARPQDERACARELSRIALDVETLWDYLHVPNARGPIEWYRYFDQDDYDEHAPPCSGDETACAIGSVLYATTQVLEHELVHAALSRLEHPPPLFLEGVAVALSCSPREGTLIEAPFAVGWRDLLDAPANRRGAQLVTYLLKEYPPKTFGAFYAALDRGETAASVAATFLDHYGTSLDDVWAQVQSEPSRAYCFPLWACQGPVSESGSYELGATCGSTRSALRLPGEQALRVAAHAGVASFRACDALSADSPLAHALELGHADTLFFGAGRSFTAQRFSDGNAIVSLEPALGQFGSNCEEAVPERVDSAEYERELYVAPVPQPVFLAYEVSEPALVSWRGNHQSLLAGEDPWTIEACRRCQDGQLTECSAPARSLEVVDRVWLRIAWDGNPVPEPLLARLNFTPINGR